MNFFPRSVDFFSLFSELALTVQEASNHLSKIELGKKTARRHALAVQKLEIRSDELLRAILFEADSTFITPIDREDIHTLAKNLNKILDYIENVVTGVVLLEISGNGKEFHTYTELIAQASELLVDLMKDLSKKGSRIHSMKATIETLHIVEKKGDELTRSSLMHLFSSKKNALTVLKWKHLYDNLELVLDACEDAANTVSSIIVKNY